MSDYSRSDLSNIENKLVEIVRAVDGSAFTYGFRDLSAKLDDVIAQLKEISRKLDQRR